jgi:L,D-transpeptidase catalytic domain/Putative peptidoglycan binding domain
MGMRGPDVALLQRRLADLHFNPGPPDGYYGYATRAALWAFQQANGIVPGTPVDKALSEALRCPRPVRPFTSSRVPTRVEISLRRQLMIIWSHGRVTLISHISTGAMRSYCEFGICGFARTPTGDFYVFRRYDGWQDSPLGWMYKPLYFYAGFALHGSTDVPLYPASHGCVRVPITNADLMYALVPDGTPVLIR